MREYLILVGIIAAASAAPLGASGPVKISDNNIENIFNININIQGVFSNNIEQDIVNVVVGLLNQQGAIIGGSTLKEQLMALAQKSQNKDLNLDIPVGSAGGGSFSFDGLATKIQEAIAEKSDGSTANSQDKESSSSYLEERTKNPQLKL